MAQENEKKDKKAYFQSAHRQSNAFGKMDKEVTPKGDGSIKPKSSDSKTDEEISKTVDTIIEDIKSEDESKSEEE